MRRSSGLSVSGGTPPQLWEQSPQQLQKHRSSVVPEREDTALHWWSCGKCVWSVVGSGPSGPDECVHRSVQSPSSDAQETSRPSVQDCNRTGSTIAFVRSSTADLGTLSGKARHRRKHGQNGKTCRDAQRSFMITSKSSSRIRCTGKHWKGYGRDGHGRCCNPFHVLTSQRVPEVTFAFRQRASVRKTTW